MSAGIRSKKDVVWSTYNSIQIGLEVEETILKDFKNEWKRFAEQATLRVEVSSKSMDKKPI
jgi:hypothetical protein